MFVCLSTFPQAVITMRNQAPSSVVAIIICLCLSSTTSAAPNLLPITLQYDALCQDPTFDAAVSVFEAHILLFKHDTIWLLDMLTYQLSTVFPISDIANGCFGVNESIWSTPRADSLYAWIQHANLTNTMNHICLNHVIAFYYCFAKIG